MAKQPVRRMIEDCHFEFFPLNPRVGLKVLTRIIKLIGEPLGLIGDGVANGSRGAEDKAAGDDPGILTSIMEKNFAPDVFAKAARALVNRLDEDEVINTIEIILDTVHGQFPGDKGTRKLHLDKDFAGEIGLLLEVFVAAIEVNFGDFFAEKLGGVVKLNRA